MGRKLIILQVEDSDSDVALAAYAFERLATHHPVHVVKDAGHSVYLEQPAKFNSIVSDFVTRSTRS